MKYDHFNQHRLPINKQVSHLSSALFGQSAFREEEEEEEELLELPATSKASATKSSFSGSGVLLLQKVETSLMDDSPKRLEVFPDHFEASTSTGSGFQKNNSPNLQTRTDSFRSLDRSWTRRKLRNAASMLSLFSLRGWGSGTDGQDKVELTAVEVESLRSEIVSLEEKEAYLKAQLEHVDEVLRSARLAGYLYIRTRWTALPGEPPIDDTDVDDWLPRFIVLHGPCIFFYLTSTDLSPQDTTLLSDVIEIGSLPNFIQDDEQIRYSFYILTLQGLRLECSSHSKIQVDSWLTTLQVDCKLGPDDTTACEDSSMS